MSNGRLTVMIVGREALPIRAIPYVTAWRESPDSIVRALAEPATVDCGQGLRIASRYPLCAYQMFDQGHYEPIPASQWKDPVITLNSLTKRLQANEREGATDENHGPWRIDAILSLPDNVFVWLDEFESWFSMTRPMISSEGNKNRLREWQAALERPSPDLEGIDELDAELFQPAGESLCLTAMLPPEIEGKLWRYCDKGAPEPSSAPGHVVAEVSDTPKAAPGRVIDSIRTHCIATRTNILDPVIEKAIEKAGSRNTASVYQQLRDLALSEDGPFTGKIEGSSLAYTDAENKLKWLTKEALQKRLRRRAEKGE